MLKQSRFGMKSVMLLGAIAALASGCAARGEVGAKAGGDNTSIASSTPQNKGAIAEDRGDEIKINQVIVFGNDSAVIEEESFPVIDAVAAIMKEHPEINFIEIAGHASRTGDANHNLVLTRKRAASVVQALVDQGIEANRLRGVGYGFYCELAGGSEDANRRVEFKVLRRGGKPTSYKWGGCSNAETKGIKPAPIPATAPTQ